MEDKQKPPVYKVLASFKIHMLTIGSILMMVAILGVLMFLYRRTMPSVILPMVVAGNPDQVTLRAAGAPAPPAGLAISAVAQTTVTLTWNPPADASDVVGYRLYDLVRINPQFSQWVLLLNSIPGPQVEVGNLIPGSTHKFAVAGFDLFGNTSARSNTVQVQTLRAPLAYDPNPKGLGEIYAVVGELFTSDVDAIGVPAPTFSLANGPTTMTVNTVSGKIEWAPAMGDEGPVTAMVRASNSEGFSDYSLQFVVYEAGTDLAPPTSVWFPIATGITTTGATLIWSPASDNVGVVGYLIMAQKDNRGQGLFIASNLTGDDTSFTLTTLVPGTGYRLWVAPYDAAGNVAPISGIPPVHINTLTTGDSPLPADTVPPSSVTVANTTNISAIGFALDWPAASDNVGVAGYFIMTQKDGPRQGSFLAGNAVDASTTFTVTDLNPDTGYRVWVAAYDAAGNVAEMPNTPPAYVTTSPVLGTVPNETPVPTSTVVITATLTPTVTQILTETPIPNETPIPTVVTRTPGAGATVPAATVSPIYIPSIKKLEEVE